MRARAGADLGAGRGARAGRSATGAGAERLGFMGAAGAGCAFGGGGDNGGTRTTRIRRSSRFCSGSGGGFERG